MARLLALGLVAMLLAGPAFAWEVPEVAPDPAALLAPRATLDPDVVAAASLDPEALGIEYLGVWADTAEECALVDLDYDYEFLTIVTPTNVEHFASSCTITAQPLVDGKVSLPGLCANEGEEGLDTYTLTFEMPDSESLGEGYESSAVRCHLRD